jgi:16S rRNA (cytosine(1402)-N(4))-methyltransferase
MLEECMEGLDIKPNGIYLDLTYGGGGHSKEIIKRLAPQGHLYGFDQDLDAKDGALTDECFTFIRSNFRYIKNWMQYYEVERVDGILADLGVSSHHLDDGGRGFSFRYDAPLDMRMNRAGKLSAKEIIAATLQLFDRITDKNLLIRRLNITTNHVLNEKVLENHNQNEQLDLFTDYEALLKIRANEKAVLEREKKMQKAIISIKNRYGKNAIFKGMNLQENSTALDRNRQIGGHKA